MSPILVRPVREQLEHDRIIRLLQAKFRRKYEVGMNPGSRAERRRSGRGPPPCTRTSCCMSQERGHRLQVVIEVETGESVNHLEALAQWAHFAKLRAPFHLYVPVGHGRCRPPALRGQPDSRHAKSGAITRSATRFASRSCTAAARSGARGPRTSAARRGRRRPTRLSRKPRRARPRRHRPIGRKRPPASSKRRVQPGLHLRSGEKAKAK